MAAPIPATIAQEVRDLLAPHLASGGLMFAPDDELVVRLMDMCETLAKANAAQASLLKAEVIHLTGDLDGAGYWLRNAEKNGERHAALVVSVICHSNLGYITKAAADFPDVVRVENGEVDNRLALGLAVGSLSGVVTAAGNLERAGGRVTQQEVVSKAREVMQAMATLDVSEGMLQRMMDEAGTLMRSRRLLWMDDAPQYLVADGSVALFYRLRVTPKTAAEMTWSLAEALSNLDLIPNGLTIGFTGCETRSREMVA